MAFKIEMGRSLGMRICAALGVSTERVTAVSIDLRPDSVASLTVVRAISTEEGDKLIEVLQQFELHDRQAK